MAWHMKLSLPKFRVTQIGATTCHRNLPRGRKATGCVPTTSALPAVADDTPCVVTEDMLESNEADPTASLHAIKQKASTAAWDQVRALLQKAAIESNALPSDQCCILCAAPATHRCTGCGAWAYYCTSCFGQAHSVANFFHVGEVWEVCIYIAI